MNRTDVKPVKRPWHRWLVGPILVIQGLLEGANVATALVLGGAGGGGAPIPDGLPPGAIDYYAALAPWEHAVGAVYCLLAVVTGVAVMAWASWGRAAIAARAGLHLGYFGFHLATSTYLAVFGWTGFAISTGLLVAALAYVLLLVPRTERRV